MAGSNLTLTTLRNVGLVSRGGSRTTVRICVSGAAKVAERQATAAQYQAHAVRLQSEISQRAWLDHRYERGARSARQQRAPITSGWAESTRCKDSPTSIQSIITSRVMRPILCIRTESDCLGATTT